MKMKDRRVAAEQAYGILIDAKLDMDVPCDFYGGMTRRRLEEILDHAITRVLEQP